MKFSIITPTLQRESLIRCCNSVDTQTFKDWEHIVAFDCAIEDLDKSLIDRCQHPRRHFACCGKKYGHFGNHARWFAWGYATGDYLVMVDDDNLLAHMEALQDIAEAIEGMTEQWAIFPIHRHGHLFFYDPPGCCYVDTANMVLRREIGRWPDIEAREADGYLCDELKAKYPYKAFPNARPIVLMEKSSDGI